MNALKIDAGKGFGCIKKFSFSPDFFDRDKFFKGADTVYRERNTRCYLPKV